MIGLMLKKWVFVWRECAQIDFEFQMEEEPISVKLFPQTLVEEDPKDSSDSFSESQDSCSNLIHVLLEQELPIFRIAGGSSEGESCKGKKQKALMDRILNYNRKAKSLEQLSKKFIDRFEGTNTTSLQLQDVTQALGVERRRMYDIINIYQSLFMVQRISKNNYKWKGLEAAVSTITAITQNPNSIPIQREKKQKSLQRLSSVFLRYFLSTQQPITLDAVVKEIMTLSEDSKQTKIRRLYDIVNVFKSLQLVQKVTLPNRKAAFKWLGHERINRLIEQHREKKKGRSVQEINADYQNSEKKLVKFQEESHQKMQWVKEEASAERKERKIMKIKLPRQPRKPKEPKEPKQATQDNIAKGIKKTKSKAITKNCQKENMVKSCSNVNDWFSAEERLAFSQLGMVKAFSQKTFLPEIIHKEASHTTLGGSQESLNDSSLEY